MTPEKTKAGLEGVIAGRSAISDLDRATDRLFYRGYDIHDLAEHSTYEETAWLLLKGELPRRDELAAFSRRLARGRLPAALDRALSGAAGRVHPMDFLRSAVSLLGGWEGARRGSAPEDLAEQAVSLVALAPALVARSGGRRPRPARSGLSHAARFLSMLTGRTPDPVETKAFDATLILYAEHGFNASTFAARVTASTLADMHSAVTSALGALKGPLHGGANEKAMEMMLEIKEPSRARAWVLGALARKEKIMGFGHRVYRTKDSRHETVKRWAGELCRRGGGAKWYDMAEIIEETMQREKGIFPNLDFFASVLYHALGIPIPLYTPIFAASRMAGWCAHVLEQRADNRLIRPDAEYIGSPPRPYVPPQDR